MNDQEFETLAQRYAAAMISHGTEGDGYRIAGYSKPNGIILMRLVRGKRSKAFAYVREHLTLCKVNPLTIIDEKDHDSFIEQVLAHACGNGFEVEWEEE